MTQSLTQVSLEGVPDFVASWSAAKIPGFVAAVIKRWRREHGHLPRSFAMVICPQVEINAIGGLPAGVIELTDPRLRCRHFTGCHKPYFVVFFTGEDAEERRAKVQPLLPWSEGYAVELQGQSAVLRFVDANEDVDSDTNRVKRTRTLQELLETGELVKVMG
ncbi:MAG: hypothetical protein WCA32_10380 [Chromatiaceae bacterium]|jgi:hypothetical protein